MALGAVFAQNRGKKAVFGLQKREKVKERPQTGKHIVKNFSIFKVPLPVYNK
ncbi:MAG: hypothetical protein J6V32_02445 [Elusimicrobiaceae bacterium]|nr:hypothetical protein [Elusimicrobiaceae bacterium]